MPKFIITSYCNEQALMLMEWYFETEMFTYQILILYDQILIHTDIYISIHTVIYIPIQTEMEYGYVMLWSNSDTYWYKNIYILINTYIKNWNAIKIQNVITIL